MSGLPEQPWFGHRLRALRRARGLSQAQLAGAGMSTAYLSRLESGARPPTAKIMAYLSAQLGVPPSAFRSSKVHSLAQALATAASGDEPETTVRLLEDALTREEGADPALRWQALWLLARLHGSAGKAEQQMSSLRAATGLADEIDIPDLRVRARTQLARCLRALGDLPRARTTAAEAMAIASEHGLARQDTARALVVLVSIDAEAGRLDDARAHADRLSALVRDAPGPLQVEALWTAAGVLTRQGDHKAAAATLEEALDLLDSGEDLLLWVRLRLAAASLYLQMSPRDTDAAQHRLAEAEAAVHLIGGPLHKQEFLALSARLAFHRGDVDTARRMCERVDGLPGLLLFRDRIRHEVLRNQLRILDGEVEAAARDMEALARQAQDNASVELAGEVWRSLAEALQKAGGA